MTEQGDDKPKASSHPVEIPSDDDPTISFANTDMDITTTPLVPVAALPSNRQDVLEADVSTALAATVMSVEHDAPQKIIYKNSIAAD
jgi:hypothetical protein